MPTANEKPVSLTGRYKQEISERHQLLIGKVIVEWPRVEQAIEELIWEIIGLDQSQGHIVTSPLDAKYKISMLRGLGIRHLRGGDLREFHSAIKHLRTLYGHRSTIAHGIWVTLPNGAYAALSRKAKLPEEFDQSQVIAVAYSENLLVQIMDHCVDCCNYLIDLRRNWHALQRK